MHPVNLNYLSMLLSRKVRFWSKGLDLKRILLKKTEIQYEHEYFSLPLLY